MANRLERLAMSQGCTIKRFGNMFQLRKDGIGNVYQSHRKEDLEKFLYENSDCFLTFATKDYYVSNRAVKYGRVIYV